MQLHTFIVDSALEAVERIRRELGPEAVVVSVRRLPPNGLSRLWKSEQVEVIAGVGPAPAPMEDPVEALREEVRHLRARVTSGEPEPNRSVESPGIRAAGSLLDVRDEEGIAEAPSVGSGSAAMPYSRPGNRGNVEEARGGTSGSRIARLLEGTGLLPRYAEQIADEVLQARDGVEGPGIGEELELARNYLRARWVARRRPRSRIHLFAGPGGSGKSTVLAKWAAQAVLVGNEAAAIYQLDAHVANVSPLPSLYAELLGARFERNLPEDWDESELSFIDLPGFSASDEKGMEALRRAVKAAPGCHVHLVLNGAYEAGKLIEQARSWEGLGAVDLIVTHLDEESRWGKVWNLVMGTNLGVSHFSSGQNIPGDFIFATAEALFTRQFGAISA